MQRFTRYAAAAMAAVLLVSVFGLAQDRRALDQTQPAEPNAQKKPQPQPPTVQPGQAQVGAWQMRGDSQLATWLVAECQAEIDLAKFALEKTKNEDVREFARQEVFDHHELVDHLRRFAPLPSITGEEADPLAVNRIAEPGTAAAENRDGTSPQRLFNNPLATTPRTGETQAPAIRGNEPAMAVRGDLARLKQEISRQCVATFQKELGAKKGSEFDNCFIGQQFMAHLMMTDTLSVMKRHASADLRNVIEQSEIQVEEHLDHARTLMKEMDRNRSNERTAFNPE